MKAVIITGSAGGIGGALVEEDKKAGYYTIGLDRRGSDIADVNIEADLSALVNDASYQDKLNNEIVGAIGKRDLMALINNAAVQVLGGIDTISLEDFRATLDVNLTAPFVLTKLMFKKLKESKGSVVNIGSIHAKLTKP